MAQSSKFESVSFPVSKLGCLLLHSNDTDSVTEFNPFWMMQVNLRVRLNVSKLMPVENDEADNNVLLRMVNCSNLANSPIAGLYYGVFTSFAECMEGDVPPTYLKAVYGYNDKSNLKAVPADIPTLKKGLAWMRGQEDPSDGSLSAKELVASFLSLLQNSLVPNASVESLTEFIKSRSWDEKHLWGGTMEEFWTMVERTQDEREKWRILRLFINSNMAWQTRLVFFPVDSLHRTATSDMAFNGLVLPGSDIKLRERVSTFVRDLVPVNAKNSKLSLKQENGPTVPIDSDISLWYNVPTDTGPSYLMEMQHFSSEFQANQAKLTPHTVIDLLRTILTYFKRSVIDQELSYLYYPGETTKGIEATLCGVKRDEEQSTKPSFRDILIRDHLCDLDSWKDLSERIESINKKQWDWKDELELSTVYIYVWLEKFTKVAYDTLKLLLSEFPQFSKVDTEAKLGLISEMSLEEFRGMFRHHQGKNYPRARSLDSFRLDADQPTKEPAILNIFSKNRSKPDPINSDPYKKPLRVSTGTLPTYFPPAMLDFVWLLLYAHLSPSSFESISLLTEQPITKQAEVSSDQAKVAARKYLRCVILTISISHTASAKYWQGGYFPRDRTGTKTLLANKMSKVTQMIFLMMSAISHTCPFFRKIGISPNEPDITVPISEWMEGNDLPGFVRPARDAVLMYTFFFSFQIYLQLRSHMEGKEEFKKDCCDVIDITLRDITGLSSITSNGTTRDDLWLGNHTLGQSKTLSMSPDPVKLKELSERKGHLLQVLGNQLGARDEGIKPIHPSECPVTHRISQFFSWRLHLHSFSEELKNFIHPSRVEPTSYGTSPGPEVVEVTHAGAAAEESEGGVSTAPRPEVAQVSHVGATVAEESEGGGETLSVSDNLIEEILNPNKDHLLDNVGFSEGEDGSTVVKDISHVNSRGEDSDQNEDATDGIPPGKEFSHEVNDEEAPEVQVDTEAQIVDHVMNEGPQTKAKRKGAGKGRKPSKKRRKVGEEGVGQGEEAGVEDAAEHEEVQEKPTTGRKKNRRLTLQNVSESLTKIAPPSIVDLSGGSDAEKAIEQQVGQMDEETKNRCLVLFFKFWIDHWKKHNKVSSRKMKNPYVDDEAFCVDQDVSSDEESEDDEDSIASMIDDSVSPQAYDPAHRLAFQSDQESDNEGDETEGEEKRPERLQVFHRGGQQVLAPSTSPGKTAPQVAQLGGKQLAFNNRRHGNEVESDDSEDEENRSAQASSHSDEQVPAPSISPGKRASQPVQLGGKQLAIGQRSGNEDDSDEEGSSDNDSDMDENPFMQAGEGKSIETWENEHDSGEVAVGDGHVDHYKSIESSWNESDSGEVAGFENNHVEEPHVPVNDVPDLGDFLPILYLDQTDPGVEPPDSEPTRKSRKRKTTAYRKKK